MSTVIETQLLDRYLPEKVRSYLENTYYARIENQARLSVIIHDPEFRNAPELHPALDSDHSTVHVRDVAQHLLQVLDLINGLLIPARDHDRLENFIKPYGSMATYLHDIGLIDFSPIGQTMHPEFAAQIIFAPENDDLIETIWSANCGGLADYLTDLRQRGIISIEPKIVLREMLALTMAHNKSKVPVSVLNDRAALQTLMRTSISTDLDSLFRRQQVDKLRAQVQQAHDEGDRESIQQLLHQTLHDAEAALAHAQASISSAKPSANLQRFYQNFDAESFSWLVDDRDEAVQLATDVIDTLRALRCADALRQRGTTLKTSARYEVFIDQGSAQAVYALRYDDERLYLVSVSQPVSVGEANIASCELDTEGNLRFSFHRGAFGNSQAVQYAVHCAALVMNDIQADVIQSFQRPATPSGPIGSLKPASSMQILIEGVDDNLNFADLAHAELIQINPDLNSQTKTVPSLQHVSELERARYLTATELDWSIEQRRELLKNVEASGHKTAKIDPELGFRHVRLSTLQPKETLLEAGAPDGFVYIPLTDGLSIIPLGGYQPFDVKAWMPLGVTGVIRGAMRNASIVATEEVQLLMIPREVFLKRWHFTYTFKELIDLLSPTSS
jgi:hypothetical protein